ncbi:hypothetical protein I8751_16760 [Nostocaceae cyanobacterium CENA357]|uniref:Hemopexin n=1 Tax=Atlanticothrix silvestris CENA357 TaxID=1725252 RepID=A0A8J7L3P0_9CYAN|nr:hemopexin repeat-containing protein [Atlanticothrix silvestris]MBH8553991.1 hypothetical protein [Atlanticothrix silvestris CENA357]
MENQKRYVKLSVGHELVGVKYEYKHFLTSTCTESYSKYLCLSTDDAYVAYFTMEIFDTDRCSFKFYDGPYKDKWLTYNGGYLYVQSDYSYLAGDFSDNGSTVKLFTIRNGTKHWFKKGNKYKNDACDNFFYIVTTTNESDALTFNLTDISSSLLDPRDRPISNPLKKAYFFKGGQYIQFDIAADRADEGYPKPIKDNWPGLHAFADEFDAALHWDNEKIYVFKGSEYIRYDAPTAQIDSGYPKPIKDNWAGMDGFDQDIDAAVNLDKGKVYFFKGSNYARYEIAAERATGDSFHIASYWPGVHFLNIDAALNLGNGKVYLFSGSEFIRYDIAADKADEGYPKPIKGNWTGLDAFADGIDAATAF